MRHARVSTLAVFALVLGALVAFARPPAPVYDTLDLASGPTLLKAPGTLHLNLAANFFGPGSPAFNGDVACTGTVLKTAGAFELGTTTLVLERQNDAEIDYPMSGGPVPIYAQVVEFGLTGSSPIQFTVSGQAQSWNVTAVLSDTRAPVVEHTLSRTADTSGTFSGSIKIPLLVKFTRNGVVKTLDLGVVELAGSSVTWATIATSNTAGLAVPQLSLGVALTGTFTSSDLDLNVIPGAVNPNRPGATYIDPMATVSGSVATIGRQCTIGAGAVIDAGVVIGPHAIIGSNVHVFSNAIIGDYASIDSGATIGSGAAIGSSVLIGAGCQIGEGTALGDQVAVSSGTTIGDDAFIHNGTSIASDCTIGVEVEIGQDVSIGTDTTVEDGVQIYSGAAIASSVVQSLDIVLATYSDGSTELLEWPPSLLPTGGPSFTIDTVKRVMDILNFVVPLTDENTGTGTQTGPGHYPDDLRWFDLAGQIGTTDARPPFGEGPTWNGTTVDCNTYCSLLHKRLTDLEYETTFTIVRRLNPAWKWNRKPNTKKWLVVHSYVDIHWGGNLITWIDAQLPNDEGIDNGYLDHKFDDNDDGVVTFAVGVHVNETTDGDLCIEVFDSREQAEEAYGHEFESDR